LATTIDKIREKLKNGEYEFAIPTWKRKRLNKIFGFEEN